jgi:glycosyltransferase involved in cell wall biosynthesis
MTPAPIASIVIPAHNEAAVIDRCLVALTAEAGPNELEILVVCNGCSDQTAALARRYEPQVRVIETSTASKTNALNLGDEAASAFPRLYMDADVELSAASVRAVVAALADGRALAAAPRAELAFPPGAGWAVRAYHRVWMSLPHVREGMITAGVYAVSAEGRHRFGRFPEVIADDGYFRMLFTPAERVEVAAARSRVWTPANLADLIRTRTRSRLGLFELKTRFPDLFRREARSKDYGRAVAGLLARPVLYPAALVYAWVTVVSRARANRQMASAAPYAWERDESSRALART